MIFAFLIDTSVSMEQVLSSSLSAAPERNADEQRQQPNESLFSGEKDRVNRRWQRKNLGSDAANATTHRTTRLDCAKSIVEQVVANRQCFENDKYMLVTYGGASNGCIRSNLKDSRATLLSELRKLEAKDRFSGGTSLTALFDQLSLMRSAYDLDTYGYGRYPALNEPVHIVWLTDGASVVTPSGVRNKLNLPVNNTPWVEAYLEPFRWDQRMTILFLHDQDSNHLCGNKKHSSESTLMPMCSVMGGTAHHIGSMHQAQRFVESFAPARAAPNSNRTQGSAMANIGVLVNFERIDDNPSNPGNTDLRTLLHTTPSTITSAPLPPPNEPNVSMNGASYGNSAGVSALINGHLGYFPIPEPFWPDTINPPRSAGMPPGPGQQQAGGSGSNSWQITRRSAHPTLGYSQAGTEWSVPPQFPFDKYQIDTSSNVAQKLLAAAQAAQTAHEAQGGKGQAKPICWAVFINGSYTTTKNSGFPFGMLRPNSARTAVNLFVLPYNFVALWKILGKLDAHVPGQHPNRNAIAMSPSWRREFEEYLQHTPGYYAIPLKRAFNLFGVPHGVFPKSFGQSSGMRNITHYSVRLHNIARKEWDRVHPGSGVESRAGGASGAKEKAMALEQALLSFDPASDISHLANNAFDVDRSHCLATLSAMRRVFVRECMATQSAYFRANAVVPPSLSANAAVEFGEDKKQAMDVDDDDDGASPSLSPLLHTSGPISPYIPPVASMEYSLYGMSNALESNPPSPYLPQLSGSRQPLGSPGRQRAPDPDLQQLVPGMQLSPLGGLVDVASEDDRDSRHSVPIRDMGEYGAAMNRIRAQEARDPLLDERTALQQRRNMFGNPYRRPMREPRGPTNNILARNPELSVKLGLSRGNTSRTPGGVAPSAAAAAAAAAAASSGSALGVSAGGGISNNPVPRTEPEDEAGTAVGMEMESEAEVNEFAIDKMFEGIPLDVEDGSKNPGNGGKYWWMQRRNVPRRRSINAPWRKNDDSWNVNPWEAMAPVAESGEAALGNISGDSSGAVADLSALTYTADALVIDKQTARILRSTSNSTDNSPAQSTSQATIPNLAAPSPQQQQHQQQQDTTPMQIEGYNGGSSSLVAGSQDGFLLDQTGVEDARQPSGSDGTAHEQVIGSSAMDVGQETPADIPSQDTSSASPEEPGIVKSETRPPNLPTSSTTASGTKVNVASEKAWFMKHIKADPADYDEEEIVQHLADLQQNPTLGKPHLKIIVTAAMVAAKSLRKKQLISRLEKIVAKGT